jgi:hypothetical protein
LPPLSWHLTKKQRQAIETCWESQDMEEQRLKVLQFLKKGASG